MEDQKESVEKKRIPVYPDHVRERLLECARAIVKVCDYDKKIPYHKSHPDSILIKKRKNK